MHLPVDLCRINWHLSLLVGGLQSKTPDGSEKNFGAVRRARQTTTWQQNWTAQIAYDWQLTGQVPLLCQTCHPQDTLYIWLSSCQAHKAVPVLV